MEDLSAETNIPKGALEGCLLSGVVGILFESPYIPEYVPSYPLNEHGYKRGTYFRVGSV